MTTPEAAGSKHWLEKMTDLLEKNIVGVKLGIYGVALCGLGVAFRSVRPFKKFATPAEIPHSFIESNIKLNGLVTKVDITPKTLLIVDHNPILWRKNRKPTQLPVNIEGINISTNGISWLQTIVVGSPIEFILLQKQPTYVSCLVYQKKRNIANHLVSLGFASVAPYNFELNLNEKYCKYYKSLLKEEETAERKGQGMWMDSAKKSWIDHFLPIKLPVFK